VDLPSEGGAVSGPRDVVLDVIAGMAAIGIVLLLAVTGKWVADRGVEWPMWVIGGLFAVAMCGVIGSAIRRGL
jgi:hypothetical protein